MKRSCADIFVILLNWNGKKDTLECLASLKQIPSPQFQAIVVDNGSSDDSVAKIRSLHPEIPILETKENLGFAGGNNIGIQWSLSKGAQWIFLLNNDTTVSPDLLNAFLQAAIEQPKAKIFGAKIYRYDRPTLIDHLGGMWDSKRGEFISLMQGKMDDGVSFETMQPVDYVCGAALFMHRSVPQAIGLLEPSFFLFWEETDFCYRAKRAGFEIWTAPKAKVWHKVSSSFIGGKPHMHYFWWRSRLLWIERNCPFSERQPLYRKVLFPELWKMLRHYILHTLKRLLFQRSEDKLKALRCKAGLAGAIHYWRKRFGNCPKWLIPQ